MSISQPSAAHIIGARSHLAGSKKQTMFGDVHDSASISDETHRWTWRCQVPNWPSPCSLTQGQIEITRKYRARLEHNIGIYFIYKATITRRVQFVGQFHFDPLTSAVPGARLATSNEGPVNMEKYVKVTRPHRVDREKPKHNVRFEPYSAKGADTTQRRQEWKEKLRGEKYDFRMRLEMFSFGLTQCSKGPGSTSASQRCETIWSNNLDRCC